MDTFEGSFPGWVNAGSAACAEEQTHAYITALVHQYSAMLYRVAYSVTRNAAEAEDVVQETFLRVLRHQEKLADLREPRVWLVRIAWNLVLDRKRRTKTRPETEDVETLIGTLPTGEVRADDALIAGQRHARILRMIDELPAKERKVLLLSAIEELSTVEIAKILGTTESTVRSRIFRARRALAASLQREADR